MITLTLLIADLVDLFKIKPGSLQLMKEQFCINDLISEIVVEIELTEQNLSWNLRKLSTLWYFRKNGLESNFVKKSVFYFSLPLNKTGI